MRKKSTKKTEEPKVEEPKAEPQTEVAEEKNEEQPVVESSVEEEKVRAQKYMITYDKEEKLWVVKKTNAKKASKKFKTKADAYEYAERLATERDMALTVKKKDGKFQKAENAKKSVSARKSSNTENK